MSSMYCKNWIIYVVCTKLIESTAHGHASIVHSAYKYTYPSGTCGISLMKKHVTKWHQSVNTVNGRSGPGRNIFTNPMFISSYAKTCVNILDRRVFYLCNVMRL